MLTNAASPVFLAHVRRATDNYDDFKLLSTLFKLLELTGHFVTIDGIRVWVEGRTTDAPIRVMVPCDNPDSFRDYLRVLAEAPEDATDAFLTAVQGAGDVVDAIYAGKGWKPVQRLSWPGFFEAYLAHDSVIESPTGCLYEVWR